jgi:hypothetical protein
LLQAHILSCVMATAFLRNRAIELRIKNLS